MMYGTFKGERLAIWFRYTNRWNLDCHHRQSRELGETPEWEELRKEGTVPPLNLDLGALITTCYVQVGKDKDSMATVVVGDAMYSLTERRPFAKEIGRQIALQRVSDALLAMGELELRREVAFVYRNRKGDKAVGV